MKNWHSICALNEGAEISIYDEIGAYGVSVKASKNVGPRSRSLRHLPFLKRGYAPWRG